MKLIKIKRRGVTLLEVILALGIISLIAGAVLNGMILSAKIQRKGNSLREAGNVAFAFSEKMKSFTKETFIEFLLTMKEKRTFSLLPQEYYEIMSEDKDIFQEEEADTNMFKVYKQTEGNMFVKISYPHLDFNEEYFGIIDEIDISGSNIQEYNTWKSKEKCRIKLHAKKVEQGLWISYRDDSTEQEWTFIEDDIEGIHINLAQESGMLYLRISEKDKVSVVSSSEYIDIFFMNDFSDDLNLKVENADEGTTLNLFNQGNSNGAQNSFEIETDGEKIHVYYNGLQENPQGEYYRELLKGKFRIEVYEMDGNDIVLIEDTEGYVMMERFKL